MREEHVIDILEGAPLTRLSEGELAKVRAHAAACDRCRRAYDAARISSLLVRERAAAAFEPPPFFQTRVMAALRERRAANEAPSLRRLWKAAGALVSSMAATVAALAVFTLFAPGPTTETGDLAAVSNRYSAEEVILERDGPADDDMTYEQVLTTIYGSAEDAPR